MMLKGFVNSRHSFQIILLLSLANIIYMHASVGIILLDVERMWDVTRGIYLLWPALFDLIILVCAISPLFLLSKKLFGVSLFVLTFVVSVSNVIYSRFFGSYMFLDAWGEFFKRDKTGFMLQYLDDSLRYSDIVYVVFLLIAIFIFIRIKDSRFQITWRQFLYRILLALVISFTMPSCWSAIDEKVRGLEYIHSPKEKDYGFQVAHNPNIFCEKYGAVFTNILIGYYSNVHLSLGKKEIQQIEHYIDEINTLNCSSKNYDAGKNCVVLLIESYLSIVSDLVVDGIEVTPNLNKLRKAPKTYFNGSVDSNIALGVSSDGQMIYMTGLLPLKNSYTISKIKDSNVIGLADLYRQKGYSTMITIPSLPDSWNQQKMSAIYGFDTQNSSVDMGATRSKYLSDSLVVSLALMKQQELEEPFFHLILTSEMHSPYDIELYPSVFGHSDTYSEAFCVYLSKCQAMDRAIGRYLDTLKERNQYDNTVIVVLADHEAHSNALGMAASALNEEHLPILVTNTECPLDSFYYGGIDQLDVYPTLVDMFGLVSPSVDGSRYYTGLGRSVLNRNYSSSSVTEDTWIMSDQIIRSNYLQNYKAGDR